jgi:hypothetical protein
MDNLPLQPPVSPISVPSQDTPITPKKSNVLNLIFVSLALILFGVLVGVVSARFIPLPRTAVVPTPTPTIAITPTPTIDPTTGWNTYTGKLNRFSFQYPSTVKISDTKLSFNVDGFTVQINPDSAHQWGEGMTKEQLDKLYVKVFQYPDRPDLQMYPDSAVLFSIEFKSAIEKNNAKKTTDTVDQILSTFKFTEATTSAKYSCPVSGYVDCMPVLDEAKKITCSAEAMAWYKASCPNFQGGAL